MTYTSIYAPYTPWTGRGALEAHVIETIRTWIIYYVAEYERQRGLPARSIVVPPSPESIHGGVDFVTFESYLMPEIIVNVAPTHEVERVDDGNYGAWFTVSVAAIVYVEGSQDATRALADAYGTALEALLPQQGGFGDSPGGDSTFAVRTRLSEPYGIAFPDETVRDIQRATVVVRTFLENLVQDYEGPRVPPGDPYAVPGDWPLATVIDVALIRGTPDTHGLVTADAVVLDGTVVPPVVRHEVETVDEP